MGARPCSCWPFSLAAIERGPLKAAIGPSHRSEVIELWLIRPYGGPIQPRVNMRGRSTSVDNGPILRTETKATGVFSNLIAHSVGSLILLLPQRKPRSYEVPVKKATR